MHSPVRPIEAHDRGLFCIAGSWSSLRRPILFRLAGKEVGRSLFLGIANTRTYPTGDLVRAACSGTSDLQVAAFEWLL